MPRQPRYEIVGIAQHVIQRGNNRQATFFAKEDYEFYLVCLGDAARKSSCEVHAYVLMTNHVHLLATPGKPRAIAKLMQRSCPHLTPEEAAAYEAPYPDMSYKGGVRRFPNLVPDNPDAPGAAISRKALQFWKNDWSGKSFMAIGMTDPVLGAPVMRGLRKAIRNCPEPLELPEAGHFVQEWGERVAKEALARL